LTIGLKSVVVTAGKHLYRSPWTVTKCIEQCYEPLVVMEDDGPRHTSVAAEPKRSDDDQGLTARAPPRQEGRFLIANEPKQYGGRAWV